MAGATEPGVVMGTVGYMSPEQAAGQGVDFRSDQFSFGSILYEMVTGKRAFERATRPEILAAIIRAEPDPIAPTQFQDPPPIALDRRAVPRQGAAGPLWGDGRPRARPRDPARARLGPHGRGPSHTGAPKRRTRGHRSGRRTAGRTGGNLLGRPARRTVRTAPPHFRQLTFRGAGISTARFAPGGQSVVYAAQWEGKPPELFTARLDSPEARSLGLSRAEILSISSAGQMALLVAPQFALFFRVPHSDLSVDPSRLRGVLAEEPLAGGAPQELFEDVYLADWSPDGKSLALVRHVGGTNRLEFPAGRVLSKTTRVSRRISFSPSGDRVAFVSSLNLHVTEPGGQVRDLRERALEAGGAGHERDLVQLRRGREHRAVRRRRGSPEETRDDTAGRLCPPRHLVGRSGAPRARHRELGDLRGLSGRGSSSKSLHLDRSFAVALAPGGDTLLFNEMGQSGRSGLSAPDRRLSSKAPGRRPRVGTLAGRKVRARRSPSRARDVARPDRSRTAKTHRHARAAPRGTHGFLPTAEGSGSWRRIRRTNGGRGHWISTGGSPGVDASGGRGNDSFRATDVFCAPSRPMATGPSIQRRRRKPTRSSAFFQARSRPSGPRTESSFMSAVRTSYAPASRPSPRASTASIRAPDAGSSGKKSRRSIRRVAE